MGSYAQEYYSSSTLEKVERNFKGRSRGYHATVEALVLRLSTVTALATFSLQYSNLLRKFGGLKFIELNPSPWKPDTDGHSGIYE